MDEANEAIKIIFGLITLGITLFMAFWFIPLDHVIAKDCHYKLYNDENKLVDECNISDRKIYRDCEKYDIIHADNFGVDIVCK